jgi:hypothetical protein
MKPEEIDQLMAESTRQFNELKVKEGSLEEELKTTRTHLHQLHGEYEGYRTVKNALTERVDPAAVIDPKPKKEKADGR